LKSDHIEYSLKDGVDRISQIIAAKDNSYVELDNIPSRNDLTYTNGFYVKCTALFVNIRESPELSDFYRDRALAKLYRAYVSEVAAIINGNPKCAEINIAGDFVWGVFDTPWSEEIDEVFSTGAKISSIVDIMNYKFKKSNLKEIKIGIGISYGKALVVKTGYKGSGVSEVIWMGNVINEASKLASYGNKESTDKETMVSEVIYYNLNDENKELLTLNSARDCYHGDIVNSYMNNWYKQNCP
jgi:class 3 adenylate cyclase